MLKRGQSKIEKYRYEYIYAKLSFKEVAEKYGVSAGTLIWYSRNYKYHGLSWHAARKKLEKSVDIATSKEWQTVERLAAFVELKEEVLRTTKKMKEKIESDESENKRVDYSAYLKNIKLAVEILKTASEVQKIEEGTIDETNNKRKSVGGYSKTNLVLDTMVSNSREAPEQIGIILDASAYEKELPEIDKSTDKGVQLKGAISDLDGGSTEREDDSGSNIIPSGTD